MNPTRVALLLALCTLSQLHAEDRFTRLMGWGGGDPVGIVPDAAAVGFTDLIVWNKDREYLTKLVDAAKPYGIDVYCSIWLGDQKDWQARYPDQDPPLQPLSEAEQQLLAQQDAALEAGDSRYQYGGEPVDGLPEVFQGELLCFHHPEVQEFFRAELRDICAVPGLAGIAFDYFGYRSYRCCDCPLSQEQLATYQRKHPELSAPVALDRFSLETLVTLCNGLSAYARSLKPGLKVTGHVYPVFLPEPLYGNRLNWDYCGQTVAWFFEPFWSYDKIRNYSRVIANDASGAGLIGVYVKPGKYPVKGRARLIAELRAIREGGTTVLQVCSLNDVLKDPEAREVFKSFAPLRRQRLSP